ncbi:murein biosynthesis integral membrane protein MurJ [Microvirga sp. ACRRW]|uniref:murein biosynthesis integral membrane protein MurJ n=1 Tax=Microvirga sp. ACRRW TaxID=2918205 RepID=UPI001EF3EF3B|nr:murein biosynthesis integral membrane protein MurJ [Microvirga sp. ACRRW]MCG7392799.1 murein biosynthesis integral membrane protein MurJ [Microvirga sp. ACRRW]
MSLIRSSLLVGLSSIASRILGFVRDMLFAQALGAGPVADAFLTAFRLPNLVRRIVGEGGLNPALVPQLSRLEQRDAATMAGDVLSTFALALLALTALVEIGAGLIALLLAPGLRGDAGTLALTAFYTRLSFPIVLSVTLSSIAAAILNMRGRYAAAALAPLAVNAGLILTLVMLETVFIVPLEAKAAWLSAASSIAGFIQLLVVLIALRQGTESLVHFRKPRWSPMLKSLLLAGFPALVASGAVQLFVLAGTIAASFWPSGISWLYYADRVMQLPLGLMAALGSSVLLPELARQHHAGETKAIIHSQHRALEMALLLALPASAALLILSFPITRVLFERGAFLPSDTQGTALVLAALSLGLPFATAGKVLSQTLFARGALRMTLIGAALGILVTLVTSVLLGPLWGVSGIALGISLACAAHALAMAWLLNRIGLWQPDRLFLGRLIRIAASTALMSLGLWGAVRFLTPTDSLSLTAFCIGGLSLYALAAWLTGAVTRDDWAALR